MSATRPTCSRKSSTVSNSRAEPDQLGQVLQPALGLDRVLGLELGDVAGAVESASSSGAGPVGHLSAAPSSSARKAVDALDRPAGDAGLGGPAQRLA